MVVYVVDDDASIRDSLSLMLGLAGLRDSAFRGRGELPRRVRAAVWPGASWRTCDFLG